VRIIRHRVTISRRDRRSAVPLQTSATGGSPAPTSPRSSAGTARDRGQLPPAFAAPALIHHLCDTAADDLDGSDAPGVLLLQGPASTSLMWRRLVPVLSRRGLRPCTVARPDSAAGPGVEVDPFAEAADIAQLLDDDQRPPAVIVGHSVGAGVALALAASAPRHVRALVLLAPGPQSISLTDRLLGAAVLGPAVTCLGFRAAGLALHIPVLRRRILITGAGLNAGEATEVVRRITYGSTWRSFTIEQRRLLSDAHRRHQQFRRIDCPILIIAGTHDRIVAARTVTTLHKRLPGSTMTTTATGHLIPIDDPDSVADAVLRALRYEYRNSLSTRPSTSAPRRGGAGASVHAPIHENRDQR
jgi:pimeloyl-ACP methyl ester carboxylesterase